MRRIGLPSMRRAARLVRPRRHDHRHGITSAFVGQRTPYWVAMTSPSATRRWHARTSGQAVHDDEAVEAHADTAEDAARPPAAPCRAPGRLAQLVEHRGDGLAGSGRDGLPSTMTFTPPARVPGRSTRNGAGSRWGGVPGEQLSHQTTGCRREADSGALVTGGMPYAGCTRIRPDHREMVGQIGP